MEGKTALLHRSVPTRPAGPAGRERTGVQTPAQATVLTACQAANKRFWGEGLQVIFGAHPQMTPTFAGRSLVGPSLAKQPDPRVTNNGPGKMSPEDMLSPMEFVRQCLT